MKRPIAPAPVERVVREEGFIVSMTDIQGRITHGSRIFIEFSGCSEAELLGSQHGIIRHPDMPRAVFRLLCAALPRPSAARHVAQRMQIAVRKAG